MGIGCIVGDSLRAHRVVYMRDGEVTTRPYSLRLKKTVVVDFDQSCLTAHLIQNFYTNSKIDKSLLKYL